MEPRALGGAANQVCAGCSTRPQASRSLSTSLTLHRTSAQSAQQASSCPGTSRKCFHLPRSLPPIC